MGYETRCIARVRDSNGVTREAEATVLLESDELIVRGEARIRVPRSSIRASRVRQDSLAIEHSGGTVALALGAAAAAKWKAKLEQAPKSLIDKLDVQAGAKVSVAGVTDPDFVAALGTRSVEIVSARAACDVAFLAVERASHLSRIGRTAKRLVESGALWVVHPRGQKEVSDVRIMDAAKAIGLVATKVARFSGSHSAEKLVWPTKSRALPGRAKARARAR